MSCSASHPRGTAVGNAAVLRSNSAHAKPCQHCWRAQIRCSHKNQLPNHPGIPSPCTHHSKDLLSSRSTRAAAKRFSKPSSVSVFRSRSLFS